MTDITIHPDLIAALPKGTDISECEITTAGALRAGHDLDRDGDVADDAVVVILPGWRADDGNAEIDCPQAKSGEEAAQEYVDTGDWGPRDETTWIGVWAWRVGYALDEDGDPAEIMIDSDKHRIALDAEEPECVADEHDWRSPIEVVGGISEDPGVFGHGGGVIIREVCAHCGIYRVTDTWAQDPATGEQGLEEVTYREADEASREWIESYPATSPTTWP